MFLVRRCVLHGEHRVRFKLQNVSDYLRISSEHLPALQLSVGARQHSPVFRLEHRRNHHSFHFSFLAGVMGKGLSSTSLWKEGCQWGSAQSRFALTAGRDVKRLHLSSNAAASEQISLTTKASVPKASLCKLNGTVTRGANNASAREALGLDSSCSPRRGLAVLRAIGAAAAFEKHLTGRVPKPALYALRHSSVVTAADARSAGCKSETERTPQTTANEQPRSVSHSPSPSALNLNKHQAGVSRGPSGEAERGRSPADSGASQERSLPPLAIVEKLLQVKGGSASLPLLKDDWSEGVRRRGEFERHPEPFTSADRKSDSGGGVEGQTVQAQLGEKGIVLPEYGPGSYRILCPKCNGGSSAEAALSVTLTNETAVWCCHRATCGYSGRVGARRYVPSSSQGGAPSGFAQGSVVTPPKRPPKLPRPEDLLDLPPEMVGFFKGRGIGKATLRRNGVRMQVAFCPQKKQSVPAIVFAYHSGGELVNAKYRTLDKQFWQIKGAEKVFYGIDDVIGSETVIIVEGEMDKLALEEAGYRNCVSVPDGAPSKVSLDPSAATPFGDRKYSYVWTSQDDLSKASRFVLATDSDGPGQALAEELARRLGREKCWRVNWPVTPDGRRVKDANEALMAIGRAGVRATIEGAEPFPAVHSEFAEAERGLDGAGCEQTANDVSGTGSEESSGSVESFRCRGTEPGGVGARCSGIVSISITGGKQPASSGGVGAVSRPGGTGAGLGGPLLRTWDRLSGTNLRPLSTIAGGSVCSAVRGGQREAARRSGEAAGDDDVALDREPTAPLAKRGSLAIPLRRSAAAVGREVGERLTESSGSVASTSGRDVEHESMESAQRFAVPLGVRTGTGQSVSGWENEAAGNVSVDNRKRGQRPTTERGASLPDAEPRRLGGVAERSADTPKVRKVRLRRIQTAPAVEGSKASPSGGKNVMSSWEPLPSLLKTRATVSTKQGERSREGAVTETGHVASAGKKGSDALVGASALGKAVKALPDRTDRTRAVTAPHGSNTASEIGAIAVSQQGSDLTTERTQYEESDSDGPPSSPAASGLNDEQLAAVFAPVGPVRVVAGPGSGKTKVLTNRVAHLVLDRGVKPWNTLSITFTNKAAFEMQERLGTMLDEHKASRLAVGTFHGICARILRKSVASMPGCGRTGTYVIYDETDSASVLRNILKKIPHFDTASSAKDLSEKLGKEKAWRLKQEIDGQGDPSGRHVVPLRSALVRREEEPSPLGMDAILQSIAEQYEAELRKCNAFDFTDLLIWAVRLLRLCPSDLQAYRGLWQHLLVDEFQDTDFAQYELVRLLGEESQSVFVVGDMDQSIYGWRGADFRNMQLLFERDFPGGHVYQLRKNYRSSRNILQAAEALIRRSEVDRVIGRHKPLQLTPTKPPGMVIKFLSTETDEEEAAAVVSHVQLLVSAQGHSWGDVAILYRTNSQSRRFQMTLAERGIPFVVVGGLSFYARKEIKDIISYLKLIANPLDEVALDRVLNVPSRGIGAKALEKLHLWAASLGMSLPLALHEYRKQLPESLALTSRTKSAVQRFTLLMDHLSVMSQTESLDVLIREILQRTDYEQHIFATKTEDTDTKKERWEHVQDLRQAAREHERKNGKGAPALASFLEDVALAAAVDEEGVEGGARKAGKSAQAAQPVVKLMTIHAAKGLEFPCVFLVGLEEGLLPTHQSIGHPELVAEERRLCYVAITRARDRLFLSRAETRFHNGKTLFQRPSRFWKELA